MPTRPFRESPKAIFSVYVDDRERCPVIEFIETEITTGEKRKLFQRFEQLLYSDPPHNKEHFRNEGKGIYAIKSGPIRILCFFLHGAPHRTLVLTHGYRKQSQRIPSKERKRALSIMKEVNPN